MSIFPSSAPVCAAPSTAVEQGQAAILWIRPLIALGLATLVALILLRATPASMVKVWYGSSTYSYGFVVVPISVFLVWRRKDRLKCLQPTTSFAGLALVFIFAVTWAAGNIADVQVIQQFAFIGLLEALVWAFLGRAATRVLAFPLLFLFFAVPAGQSLVAPLQRLTAVFTVNAVRISGIPAVQDGFLISTPTGDWRIAEACSGIRYLTSSVVIGVLFAGVAFRSWKRRIAIILISAVIPILANALRAYFIILLAYFSNNHIAAGVDHVLYGWLFFSLVTAMMIGAALAWRETEMLAAEGASRPDPLPAAPADSRRLLWWMATAILIVLAASSTTDFLWSRTPPNRPIEQLWSPPAGWLATADLDHDWAPHFETVESDFSQTFTDGSREVSVYIASYPTKRRGIELVQSYNVVEASGDWDMLNSEYRKVMIAGHAVSVAEYLIARGRQHRMVWTWYLAGGQLTANPYWIKLIQAQSRLSGHPQNVSLFAISAGFGSDPVEATNNLTTFVRDLSSQGKHTP